MPIKDLQKRREYQQLWIAKKRSRQHVEPNIEPVEPLKKGWSLVKCFYCSQLLLMEQKYIPYFAPICNPNYHKEKINSRHEKR